MSQNYYYSQEIRRFLLQITRIFSNFQVAYGTSDGSGNLTYVQIPVKYGDASRQASTIIRNNSENSMPNAPMITFFINDLKYQRERIQDPTFVDRLNIRQRQFDPINKVWLPQQGNAYTIERLMPVPYDMSIKVDIWSTNANQKLEILEQILPLFNPALEIQSTDNYLDWTSLSTIELTNVTWTSRSVPVGAEEAIDIASLDFLIPIWLSVPARVKKMGAYIQTIIANLDFTNDFYKYINANDLLTGTRTIITFNNYNINVTGNISNGIIKLYTEDTITANLTTIELTEVFGNSLSWLGTLDVYGNVRPGVSEISLSYDIANSNSEIVGTIQVNPVDSTELLFTPIPSTIPTNTLAPIDNIINPQNVAPNINGLPAAINGQRYLLTADVGNINNSNINAASGWTFNSIPTVAKVNDIIEFNGNNWVISFDSSNANSQIVTTLSTNQQYKWNGNIWSPAWEGYYRPGEWTLII